MASKRKIKPQKQAKAKKSASQKPYRFTFVDSFWKSYKWSILLLFVLSVSIYYQATSYEFVLDDKIVLQENKYVAEGIKGVGKILSTESFQGYFGEQKDLVLGARYRPLSLVTFAIEQEIFGQNSFISHLINIIVYGLSILLLLRIFSLIFPLKEGQSPYWSIPFVAALLFTLHPLHVEVVANVKGRDEIMTMIGAFGALYFSFRYLKDEKWIWILLSSISYFLGLLSKENAITFLAVIPVTLYFFTKASLRQHLKVILPLIVVTIIYLVIRYQVIGYFLSSGKEITGLMNNPFLEMNYSERMATIFYTLGIYLKLLFFPHPLTHDYYPYHIPIMNWGKVGSLIPLIIYLGLGVVALMGIKKKWLISYLIIFYIATLSIVSNLLFPVGTFMNERFVFISSLSFCILAAWFLIEKLPTFSKRYAKTLKIVGMTVAGLYSAGFLWKTLDRLPAWENGFELNSAAIKVSKNSARANVFMGTAYFNRYREETDPQVKDSLLNLSEPYFDRALLIHPPYTDALTMKSGIAAERYKEDRDIDKLLEAFFLVGKYRPNHNFLIQYMDYLGKNRSLDAKMEQFYIDLAYKYYILENRNPASAKYLISKGLETLGQSARINLAAAEILKANGETQLAQQYQQKAISINPNVSLD